MRGPRMRASFGSLLLGFFERIPRLVHADVHVEPDFLLSAVLSLDLQEVEGVTVLRDERLRFGKTDTHRYVQEEVLFLNGDDDVSRVARCSVAGGRDGLKVCGDNVVLECSFLLAVHLRSEEHTSEL